MRGRWKLLLAAALLLLALVASGAPEDREEQGEEHLLYFLAPESRARGSDRIRGCPQRLDVPEGAPLADTARAVVERLLAGPEEANGLLSPLPAGVELLDLEIRDQRAYVDLSSGVNRLSGVALTMADYCLTLSLTELDGVSSVSITAQGRRLGQQPKQVFYERDVLLSTMDDVLQTVEVTLYFLDSANALTGESRTIELYEGQTLAENLAAALLEGPHNRELKRVLPEDFQINFVRMESGVCYVNISAASLAALPEDETLQRMMLWSLADSLYSIGSVEELRLLADGEELTAFGMIPVESVASRPQG